MAIFALKMIFNHVNVNTDFKMDVFSCWREKMYRLSLFFLSEHEREITSIYCMTLLSSLDAVHGFELMKRQLWIVHILNLKE